MSAGAALAHEGHGLPGASHWHGGDTSWLLLIGVAGVLGWWLARRP